MAFDWGMMMGPFMGIFWGFGIMVVLILMGAVWYFVYKWSRKKGKFPALVVLLEIRQKGLLLRLDRARREIQADGKESYRLKGQKKLIPAPEMDVLILQAGGASALFLLKVAADDYRYLKLNNLLDAFDVLIPEDAKMWYMDQQRKKAEMWRQNDRLWKWAFLVTPVIVLIMTFLMFQQIYGIHQETVKIQQEISKQFVYATQSISTMTDNLSGLTENVTDLLRLMQGLRGEESPG